ncbi:MAG: hypothetical protein AMDU5_GPLC00003G0203 [Thermoplasmatales archaeon Gpl]|nr:MAG: hypothetical protein AMDU5_GPLC00003G0203 [Thermoplasmatales archaeon Gpl]
MPKRNRMIIFAVITVVVVAAPISIYEILSPEPIQQITYSSHNLTYTIVGTCNTYSRYPYIYDQNLTGYYYISQNGENVSSLRMINSLNSMKMGSVFFGPTLYVNVSGMFQSDHRSFKLLINVNLT